ncbi:hypothetical protein LX69_02615 [Breznakibacter xylanolyticus]|uniref:Uncharacterized protein n=2 Tax=Breznakibacter xylanolyticus TaxID=990 RepID=A0A2W7NQJ7_9BACT|nr:hypothetical protein LX69_02615 [Breznakibacter xylanolyticus]
MIMKKKPIDITGVWHFREDFGYGVDEGEMTIRQNGQKITGSMVYEERIEGDVPFVVCVDIEGFLIGEQVKFKAVGYELFDVEGDWEFNLEDRIGWIYDNEQIRGSSIDEDGIEGQFIMRRKYAIKEQS